MHAFLYFALFQAYLTVFVASWVAVFTYGSFLLRLRNEVSL